MPTFDEKNIDGVLVLTPRQNLVGGKETNELLTAIERTTAAGPAKIVVDLGEIKFLSSLGVGLLRSASMKCSQSGGWLRLARIAQSMENTLQVTGPVIYFETFETVDMAVTAPVNPAHRRASQRPPHDRPDAV
jgi:anti-anti-sigma factor